ncbi:hypothetical protein AMECASPLE_019811 [Ameca splendens]|uniref:Uncharacterized protein n=1 Tax=Ameca splendens TaxID=208324 RepID=A0ABV0Y2Z1_9TELE
MGKRNLLSHVRTGPYGDSHLVLGVGGWGSTRVCRPPKSSHILQDIFKYDRQNLQVQFLQNHPEVGVNESMGVSLCTLSSDWSEKSSSRGRHTGQKHLRLDGKPGPVEMKMWP